MRFMISAPYPVNRNIEQSDLAVVKILSKRCKYLDDAYTFILCLQLMNPAPETRRTLISSCQKGSILGI